MAFNLGVGENPTCTTNFSNQQTNNMNEEAQQDKQIKQGSRGMGEPRSQDTACRPPARYVLEEHIQYLKHQQKNLEIIVDMIPNNPTPEQDEALFQMFLKVRNTK